MKKMLCLLALSAGLIGLSQNSVAANRPSGKCAAADSVRKKIKHPTEAMTDAQVTDILNVMRQKRNDQEKIVVLKESVKDRGITIDHLIKLLNQFLTDDSKIECAEYAFPYTTNYKAFLKIMDLFGQEGYKYKLEDFYDANRK